MREESSLLIAADSFVERIERRRDTVHCDERLLQEAEGELHAAASALYFELAAERALLEIA